MPAQRRAHGGSRADLPALLSSGEDFWTWRRTPRHHRAGEAQNVELFETRREPCRRHAITRRRERLWSWLGRVIDSLRVRPWWKLRCGCVGPVTASIGQRSEGL